MLKNIFKFIFAIALILWLFFSGRIDFSLIPKSLQYPLNWILALTMMITSTILTGVRFRWLLMSTPGNILRISQAIKLTWIGLFFNTVLPGAVTGDLVKVFYAQKELPRTTRASILGTALIDRILGVVGLVTLMGITTVFAYDDLIIYPQIKKSLIFSLFLFVFIMCFFISLFLPQRIQVILLNFVLKVPWIGQRLQELMKQVWDIGKNKSIVIKAIVISLCGQSLNILAFYILASPFLPEFFSPLFMFTFVPIGLVFTAIPISPAGLGVGHAAFAALFSLFGVKGGADYFNFFFIAMTIINLLGVIPYALIGKKIKLAELESQL